MRLFFALSFLLTGLAVCQQSEPAVSIAPRPNRATHERRASLRCDVRTVLIPVTVTDPLDRPVPGLRRENFHIFENGVEQQIRHFGVEDAPASVGIVFDASTSMRARIADSRRAVARFLDYSLPDDEFFLVSFGDRPNSDCGFTRNTDSILQALSGIQADGWTSLLDAVYLAMQDMQRATSARKALLILSDGGDNRSHYSEPEIRSLVREADVRIFAITLFERSRLLSSLAEESGGRAVRVHKLSDLPAAAARLSAEIHGEYVLGYTPAAANDGRYRKVDVKLAPPANLPPLHLSWRRGYYAPAD